MKQWYQSGCTFIWIFNVGRGVAAFVRTPLNHGILVDMGMSEDFDPCGFVESHILSRLSEYAHDDGDTPYEARKIAQVILSHPHADHISQCQFLNKKSFEPSLLTCPHDKDGTERPEKVNWDRIENPEGTQASVDTYRSLYKTRKPGLSTMNTTSLSLSSGLEYGLYYLRPPICEILHVDDDNCYGNATSLVIYFRHGDSSILFPGDITPEGLAHLLSEGDGAEKRYTIFRYHSSGEQKDWYKATLQQPSLKSNLQEHGLTFLVAPHHGLESGFSETLYRSIKTGKPNLVIISEKKHTSEQDGTVDRRYDSPAGASGMRVSVEGRQEDRRVLSTEDGFHILIALSGTGSAPRVWAEKKPERLMDILETLAH